MQQSISKAFCEGTASAQHDVAEETLAEIEISAVDGVDDDLMDAGVFEADYFGIEEDLGCAESLCSYLFFERAVLVILIFIFGGIGKDKSGGILALILFPSGRVYSTIFPFAILPALPAHSFSSLFGSLAT